MTLGESRDRLPRAVRHEAERGPAPRSEPIPVEARGPETLAALVGNAAADRVLARMVQRKKLITLNLDGIRLQYPDYASAVAERHLRQIALRMEEADYERFLAQSLIPQDVYDGLMDDIEERGRPLEAAPKLDLGLDPEKLIPQVPFLADLSPERLAEIAGMLRPYLTVPGESVVAAGETGDAMYFISNGYLRVDLEPEPVYLGSGDFFGEIALLDERLRTANVVSLGFCRLLVLSRRDFLPFLDLNPDLKARIEGVAHERLERFPGG